MSTKLNGVRKLEPKFQSERMTFRKKIATGNINVT